jgi:uncharacterized protein (DUF433 family)
MVDRFTSPLLTPKEAAHHLQMPDRTLYRWMQVPAGKVPLVHGVEPRKRGWPSLPFIGLIEAYVLRSLRRFNLSTDKIRDAATEVRYSFGTEYGLATRRIATDGVDVFVHYLESDDLARAGDGQRPIREVIRDYLHYILWEPGDEFPSRLTLPQYPDIAPVVIDPRFGWGAPVVEETKVPVEAVVSLWRAGESTATVADEYGLTRDQVEALVRAA